MNNAIRACNPRRPVGASGASDARETVAMAVLAPEGTNYDQMGSLAALLDPADKRKLWLTLDQPAAHDDKVEDAVNPAAAAPTTETSSPFGNDLVANINALLIQCMQIASELQKSNRKNDLIQAKSAFEQRIGAADDARKAAEDIFAGAMTQAWFNCAGGIANFAGGAKAAKAGGSDTQQRIIMDKGSAVGSMSQSIGAMTSAEENRLAADSKKAQDQAEALAGLDQSIGGNFNEMANALASTISQMFNELSQLIEARTQANKGIIRSQA